MWEIAATLRHHDLATGTGSVFLDDGHVLSYDADAFRAGGMRLLRVGQRVRVRLDGEPTDGAGAVDQRVTGVILATLGF